ncbi:MAG: cysteine methyltransferase, partial [Flavobacteriaceae bacterium]
MKTTFINTPLGIIELKGDAEGLASALFKDAENIVISAKIPKELNDAVLQLQEYFEGNRKEFNLKLS